jgi:hypothetical protein
VNTNELSELLRDATDGLEPATGFTQKVLEGGRRRRLRRRITMAAGALVVVVVVAGTTVVSRDDAAPPMPSTDQRLTTPTKGDLADDQAFLAEAIRVWRAELPLAQENRLRFYDDMRGEPHVVWAGNTPAGPAAVIMQQTYIHQDYWVRASWSGMRMAEGLVGIDAADGKLKLLGTRSPLDEREPVSFYLFGPDDRTMLIVDEGKPLYYATNGTDAYPDPQELGGPFRPEWRRIQAHDGAALVSIPDHSGPGQALRLAYHGDHPPDSVDINTKLIARINPASSYLDFRLSDPNYRIPIPNFFRWKDKWTFGTPVSGLNTNRLVFTVDDRIHSQWQITIWLPGRVLLLKETQIDQEKSQFDSKGSVLTVGIGTIVSNDLDVTLVDIARVDHDAALPIKYHIPDGGGWVVARKGQSLSYRTTPDGQWEDAGKDAALLPDNAVEVKVGDKVVKL